MTPSNTSQSKIQLRAQLLNWRMTLTKEELFKKSQAIRNRIQQYFATDLELFNRLAGYYPIKNEPDLLELMRQFRGTKLLPTSLKDSGRLEFREWSGVDSDLKLGKYGIREPSSDRIDDTLKKTDLLLIPAVGLSSRGSRLGYGAGYYDKYISTLSEKPKMVGICFDECINEKIPHEPWDLRVDLIITDKKVLEI